MFQYTSGAAMTKTRNKNVDAFRRACQLRALQEIFHVLTSHTIRATVQTHTVFAIKPKIFLVNESTCPTEYKIPRYQLARV